MRACVRAHAIGIGNIGIGNISTLATFPHGAWFWYNVLAMQTASSYSCLMPPMEIHRLAGALIIQRVLCVVIAVLAAVVAQSASVPPVPAKADVESGVGLRHYGYWLHGRTMKSVDVRSMAAQGATDVFLHEHAFKAHGQRDVESWIAKADAAGLKVHIWMQIFYNGSWINPVKDGMPNAALFDEKIGRAQSYARISGVAGIHLDYVRYPGTAYKTPGGADAVSEFVRLTATRLHKTSPRIVVSAALMPETTATLHYYGQDYAAITKCLDVVIPMIYKGNYKKTTPWIGSTAKWFVENSKGAKVWAGLQGYKSDDDTSPLPAAEITGDAEVALTAGCAGVVVFRWGLTNPVDASICPLAFAAGRFGVLEIERKLQNDFETPSLPISK